MGKHKKKCLSALLFVSYFFLVASLFTFFDSFNGFY